MSTLTPYQGGRRVYGLFKCPQCSRTWSSGNSWANTGQQCTKCLVNVYPFKQTRLLKGEESEGGTPHLSSHCEKCQKLGRNCRSAKRW